MAANTYDDLYIDEIYTDSVPSSNQNFLWRVSQDNPDSECVYPCAAFTGSGEEGLKWIVQLVNGTDSEIDFSATKYRLQICTRWDPDTYEDDEQATPSDFNIEYDYITIDTGTVAAYANYYIGCNIPGLTDETIWLDIVSDTTLADQHGGTRISDGLLAGTTFNLQKDTGVLPSGYSDLDVSVPVLGSSDNSFVAGDRGVASRIATKLGSNTFVTGSMRRKVGISAPKTSYVEDHWNFSFGSSHLVASAVGEPHICTLFGECYKFDHLGFIRLFHNHHIKSEEENDLIVINGECAPGPGRWSDQYIRKLFLYNGGKTMIVDTGFRGSKVKVAHNDGIDYTEKELPFHPEAKRYSFTTRFSTTDGTILATDDLPALVRNELYIALCGSAEDTAANKVELHVQISNVNEYNLQPCRLELTAGNDLDKGAATGCIVHRKYATHCGLDSIDSIRELPEPTEEELKNMPEIEIRPKLLNIKYK